MANYYLDGSPSQKVCVIVPSDTDDILTQSTARSRGEIPKPLKYARALRVSVDCILKVKTLEGYTDTFDFFKGDNPIAVTQVYSTGSTIPDGGVRIVALG